MSDRRRDKSSNPRSRDTSDNRYSRDPIDRYSRDPVDRRKRSPSPVRDRRKRSPSPDRDRRRRSPSPRDRRKRSPTPDRDRDRRKRRHSHSTEPPADPTSKKKQKVAPTVTADSGGDVEGDLEMDPDEVEMMKKMGIPVGFDSSKGKLVPGNDMSAVRVVTKRQPRQYMNRRGGFNRPLPAELNR